MKQTFRKLSTYLQSQRWFTVYFGFGIPPVLYGTVIISYKLGIVAGLFVTAFVAAWHVDTFVTVCSRCSFYGTNKCGLPGLIAPKLVSRKDRFSASVRRIRAHLIFDIGLIVLVNTVWFLAYFPFWIVVGVCTFGGYLTVFKRKRFHGLLYRLKPQTHPPRASTTAVPVTIGSRLPA